MNKTIHEKICDLRKAHALTQEKLGAALGVSSQAVSKWEKGESLPDIMLIPRLCEVLGISADSLLEIPSELEKDACMKSLAKYAKEVGDCRASYEAVCACASVSSNQEGSVHLSSCGMRIQNTKGMAIVLSGREAMEAIKGVEANDIQRVCDIFLNENNRIVFRELDYDQARDEHEIAARCGLSAENVNHALFSLMKTGMCEAVSEGKFLYGIHSYIAFALLAGIYLFSSAGYKDIHSISISRSCSEQACVLPTRETTDG